MIRHLSAPSPQLAENCGSGLAPLVESRERLLARREIFT